MPLDITFTLSDEDLQRFQEIVDKAKSALENEQTQAQIEQAAETMIEQAREANLPSFIADRLLQLEVLLNMVRDDEWKLNEDERKGILSALFYFCDPDDVIPDHIPGIGFLDDAIYTEIIIRELDSEIRVYNEFCQFRIAEENRRRNKGIDPFVSREDWLADKRSVLHSVMRERRRGATKLSGWRTRLF
jgi:uncharacterized membrane protein YkvA (DUF1232 family)